jgi:hypothetical protein
VVVLVLLTDISAPLANLCAQAANIFGKVATACHSTSGHAAYLRTVHVAANAIRHFFHIVLAEARGGAMVAGGGAGIASLDTLSVLMM